MWQGKLNCGVQVAFVFKLPLGQVEFSGLFLTLPSQGKPCEMVKADSGAYCLS